MYHALLLVISRWHEQFKFLQICGVWVVISLMIIINHHMLHYLFVTMLLIFHLFYYYFQLHLELVHYTLHMVPGSVLNTHTALMSIFHFAKLVSSHFSIYDESAILDVVLIFNVQFFVNNVGGFFLSSYIFVLSLFKILKLF